MLQEKGIEDSWDYNDVFDNLVVKALYHHSGDVRLIAIELVIIFHKYLGEDVRRIIEE